MDIDYTKIADDAIEQAKKRSEQKEPITNVVSELLVVEKKLRLAGKEPEVLKVCRVILDLIAAGKNWTMLSEQVNLLSRRRAQTVKVIKEVVKIGVGMIDLAEEPDRTKLIDSFLEQVAGKIFLEIERVKLTELKTQQLVAKGDHKEASKLMQSVQIETYGTIDKEKRLDFMLEQMKLLLKVDDFIRMAVVRNKIKEKLLRAFPERCKTYNQLSVQLFLNDENFVAISEGYWNIHELLRVRESSSETKMDVDEKEPMKEDKEAKKVVLDDVKGEEEYFDSEHFNCAVVSCILAEYSEEQAKVLKKYLKIVEDRKQEGISELISFLLKVFNRAEPMTPIMETLQKRGLDQDMLEFELLYIGKKIRDPQLLQLLKTRSLQHNIRIYSLYYTQMTLDRVSEFLDVSKQEAEDVVCKMVGKDKLWARIDQLTGIIKFRKPVDNTEVLSGWTKNVDSMLDLVAKTSEMINKETQQTQLYA